jgi:HNH endonuclease
MAKQRVPQRLREQVKERAHEYCEYCLVHERFSIKPYQADHIIPERHGGVARLDNLAWACPICNFYKGADVGTCDPATGRFAFLFNPRTQRWRRHFRLNGPAIEPLTASGRVTIALPRLNSVARIQERQLPLASGYYP